MQVAALSALILSSCNAVSMLNEVLASMTSEEEDEEDDDGNPECVVDAYRLAVVEEVPEPFSCFADAVRVVVAIGDLGDTSCDCHRSERCDERRNAESGHEISIEDADDEACDERDEHRHPWIHSLRHHRSAEHRRHTDHGSDRKIDIAGDEHV